MRVKNKHSLSASNFAFPFGSFPVNTQTRFACAKLKQVCLQRKSHRETLKFYTHPLIVYIFTLVRGGGICAQMMVTGRVDFYPRSGGLLREKNHGGYKIILRKKNIFTG